jgi:hypothetical protein
LQNLPVPVQSGEVDIEEAVKSIAVSARVAWLPRSKGPEKRF